MSEQTTTTEVAVNPAVQEPSEPTTEANDEVEEGQEAEVQDAEPKVEPEETVETLKEKLKREREAFEKRIGRKTAATKALEQQLQEYKQKLNTPEAVANDAKEPKIDDFESYDDYEKAIVEHKANQLLSKREQEQKQAQLAQAQQRQMEEQRRTFEKREAEYATSNPEYERAAENVGDALDDLRRRGLDITSFGKLLLESEKAPALIHELSKDTGLLEELVQLQPLSLMRELVKLELGLQTKPKLEKVAPKPIKPLSGNASGKKQLHEMNYEEREAYFKKMKG